MGRPLGPPCAYEHPRRGAHTGPYGSGYVTLRYVTGPRRGPVPTPKGLVSGSFSFRIARSTFGFPARIPTPLGVGTGPLRGPVTLRLMRTRVYVCVHVCVHVCVTILAILVAI